MRDVIGAAGQDGPERAQYSQALSDAATVENAIENPYATVLLRKLALVGVAVALGGMNRFLVMPRLLTDLRASNGSWDKQ